MVEKGQYSDQLINRSSMKPLSVFLERKMSLKVWKECERCLKLKTKRANFSSNLSRHDGVSGICKQCHQEMRVNNEPKPKRLPKRERQRQAYENSPEKVLESTWFGNPDERRTTSSKTNWPNRIKHSEWDADEEQIVWRGPNHRNHSNHGQ